MLSVLLILIYTSSTIGATLENDACKIVVSSKGATISEFSLKSKTLNPIHEYDHFICFDRWGPSEDEGIPWHGNGSKITYSYLSQPTDKGQYHFLEMSGLLPVVKLRLNRKIYLDKNAPVARVIETITNENNEIRDFNLVQHPTIGKPFLDETTIVDTKVDSGYSQKDVEDSSPNSDQVLGWPQAFVDGKDRDLRYLIAESDYEQVVVSYILNKTDEYGWVTAINAELGMLIGYMWPIEEYPWLNLWLQVQNNEPFARGLEFGTTGLHQPWSKMYAQETIFGQPLWETIAVSDTVTKSYFMFLSEIPNDFKGVENVEYQDNKISIYEYGSDPERTIEIELESNLTHVSDNLHPSGSNEFLLSQNFPNPFNSYTTIQYFLPVSEQVSLDVYNLQGQRVKTLVNNSQKTGHHTMKLDMGHHPAGIYFYQFQYGDQSSKTEKMLYIK